MRIWWCNQGQCWDEEHRAGVVCAVRDYRKIPYTNDLEKYEPTYRKTVSYAKKGDIVVHYVGRTERGRGYVKEIRALSRAKMDAVECCILIMRDKGERIELIEWENDRGRWQEVQLSRTLRPWSYLIEHKDFLGRNDDYAGWLFETEYFDFRNPIPRDKANRQIIALNLDDCPFINKPSSKSHGNVKERYFSSFDKKGLRIIRQMSQEKWPQWAEDAIK